LVTGANVTNFLFQWSFFVFILLSFSIKLLQFYSNNILIGFLFNLLGNITILIYTLFLFKFDFRDWRILKNSKEVKDFFVFGYHTHIMIYIITSVVLKIFQLIFSIHLPTYPIGLNLYDLAIYIFILIQPTFQKFIDRVKPIMYFQIKFKQKPKISLFKFLHISSLLMISVIISIFIMSSVFNTYFKFNWKFYQLAFFIPIMIYTLIVPFLTISSFMKVSNLLPSFNNNLHKIIYFLTFTIYISVGIIALYFNLIIGIFIIISSLSLHFLMVILSEKAMPLNGEIQIENGLLFASVIY